jgi:hypothetical protein
VLTVQLKRSRSGTRHLFTVKTTNQSRTSTPSETQNVNSLNDDEECADDNAVDPDIDELIVFHIDDSGVSKCPHIDLSFGN